eukprot:CAMPEP_0201723650 /NCGR_PEP_ID=MMETSP0593-20130828/7625_1 /ASSEMBLY_ACC=CAM_ASM_000672 /TAXON_ID=267983 /ORGANISM="Skeletonema japonicum, Strain CCMP2506" /LENGTH=965 /DNA_ID=CAMNT_0048214779 /DNA_START=107 /DNA_END=3004 /DNA_ORIENTATION=+
MGENKAIPTLKATDWHLLPLPSTATASSVGKGEQEQIQVGVIEIHPNNQKIVYATRRRSDHGRDLGKELIVVQDITTHDASSSSPTTTTSTEEKIISNNPTTILCSFTLRQLIQHLNQFRENEYQSSISDLTNAEEILQGGHMDAVTSLTVPLVSVQSLGAVQHLTFLDRGALRDVVAPGLVVDDDDDGDDGDYLNGRERLLIGFRRCMVVLSIDSNVTHDNNRDNKQQQQQLHIEAFIGPTNIDEYENDTKIQKRQPSSFAIPISEHILAYGCYDGGIRFYDVHKRQQVKACLGPNGRTNPIVKMVLANPTRVTLDPSSQHRRRPRIISVCVSASAYLWELDISIDLPSSEINHFDIPPPMACFDGMVAAVSARGVPVTYPPPLSPTTRATLSPCSSWDQTDLLHEQFRISYDARQDRLCFVFSPDAIGTSLNPKATRQERMDLNGALVVWDLSNLPLNAWPLPTIAPLCVTSLPRTENGRVTSDLTLPGYYCCCSSDEFAASVLVTLYATSANEIAAAVTNLSQSTDDCVQKGVSSVVLTDLSTLQSIEGRSGFECYSLSFSGDKIAIGTQHGSLLAKITEDLAETASSLADGATSEYNDTSDANHTALDGNGSISDDNAIDQKDLDGDGNITVKEGIHRFNQTDNQRKPLVDESSSTPSDLELPSTNEETDIDVVKEELRRALERLKEENENNKALATELEIAEKKAESNLRSSAGQSSNMFGDSMKEPRALLGAIDDSTKEELALQSRISDALSLQESEISSHHNEEDDVSELTGDYVQTMQEENDDLRRQVHELVANKDDVSDVSDDGDLFQKVEREQLHKQLSIAKEREQSLRDYIELLEQNKDEVDVELETARLDAEKSRQEVENLTTDVYEQKLALQEMAGLLKEQQQAYAEAVAKTKNDAQEPQLETNYSDEVMANLENENAQLKEEVELQIAMSTAMKVELQNALNEVAEMRRGE